MKGRFREMARLLPVASVFSTTFFISLILSIFTDLSAQPYRQQRCSHRLENALEHVRRRSVQVKSSRSVPEETPYTIYHSLYGQNEDQEDDFYGGNRGYYAKNMINRSTKNAFPASMAEELGTGFNQRQPHKLIVSRVEVEDLKVKMPQKVAARWVEVDKCDFSTVNSTLETRLIFPDLTISGKVVLQPTGGKCNMILRLRHAGIEFRTIPIGFDVAANEESRRSGTASVRTDSHFAEPGFISVFAHGCQGPTGIRLRQNSKRRFGFAGEKPVPGSIPSIELSEPQILLGTGNTNRWGKHQIPHLKPSYHPLYDIRSESYMYANRNSNSKWPHKTESNSGEFYDDAADRNLYRRSFRQKRDTLTHERKSRAQEHDDRMQFNDDILNFADDDLQDLVQPDARAFADFLSGNAGNNVAGAMFSATGDRDEVDDAFTNELEKLFSMGVRSLLTTYMQRALQPAIKETLMENMGYTLSYG